MMKNLCAVTLLAASLYTGNVYAQPAAVKKIIEIGTTGNVVMALIAGRGSGGLSVVTNR